MAIATATPWGPHARRPGAPSLWLAAAEAMGRRPDQAERSHEESEDAGQVMNQVQAQAADVVAAPTPPQLPVEALVDDVDKAQARRRGPDPPQGEGEEHQGRAERGELVAPGEVQPAARRFTAQGETATGDPALAEVAAQ